MFGYFHILYSYYDSPYSKPSIWCIVAKILCSIAQFCDVIRVFDQFRTIVAMVRRTLNDIKYFLSFVLFSAYIFSMCFLVL